MASLSFERPYVVSWNLTYRCNLACEHCYLDAGGRAAVHSEAFADRSELSTGECYRVVDQIAAFAPEALTILTGGEPLLRRDILDIVRHAVKRGLWVVVGTNGVRITETLAAILRDEGVRGLALSLDALEPEIHDGFRRVRGAWQNTVEGAKILDRADLPFIVQTTAGRHNLEEIGALADFAYDELQAKVWNLYFLVQTGRGQFVSDMEPTDYDLLLARLHEIQERYRGRMLVNAKCAPHYVKHLFTVDPGSPFLKSYTGGAGGCPAGTHYMGIRPNGDLTPCPYLPVFAGNLRHRTLEELWRESDLFRTIRERATLGGRCGDCELAPRCGGCRARAYGVSGDLMAEDPLCTHQPGTFPQVRELPPPAVEYGASFSPGAPGGSAAPADSTAAALSWDPDAEERMQRVPAFVRGMVMRAVESHCTKNGLDRVTLEELERIRERMPTPKLFGRR